MSATFKYAHRAISRAIEHLLDDADADGRLDRDTSAAVRVLAAKREQIVRDARADA